MYRSVVAFSISLALSLGTNLTFARADDADGTAALSGPQIGAPAPDFALRTLAGRSLSLASFHGKTLVVNVWATWCPPCRQEMPDLIAAAKALQKSGVAVLGIDSTEEAPIVRAYVAAKNVSYPQAIDETKAFSTAYDVQYFPTTYVIDPSGILRARYIDIVAPKQLKALVADAAAGRNGVISSPLQSKIDATLATANFTFTGDAVAIAQNAASVRGAIAKAELLLDDSDAANGNATDLLRTRAEEARVRDLAIASLPSEAALLPGLRGDAARDREQWQPAIDAYRIALASDPKDDGALGGIAIAASRLKRYDLVVDADTKLAALNSKDVGALVDLARAQVSAGNATAAYATFDAAIELAKANLTARSSDPKRRRMLAYAHMYYGRAYAKAGDATHARAQFDALLASAAKLPATDVRHDMYLEEGQEALVALRLGESKGGATVSLVPWTGADLPGSIPNTIKYRLVVAGDAGKNVALAATGVPKGWVASFCSDRVCAPFRVSVAIPESGVKIVEFQLVAPRGKPPAPKVRVTGSGDGHDSSATT